MYMYTELYIRWLQCSQSALTHSMHVQCVNAQLARTCRCLCGKVCGMLYHENKWITVDYLHIFAYDIHGYSQILRSSSL